MDQDNKLPVWCSGKSWCPITATAKIIGKKWHPVIIHRLIQTQPIGFNALKREVDGISSKVLSESLEDLQDKGIIEREILNNDPKRVEYSLTKRGRTLKSVIRQMKDWGEQNLAKPEEEKNKLN